MSLVHKDCGACSVCCKELMFDLNGSRILAGVMCPHAAPPQGCTIHATRPQVCRSYFCGWHHLPSLGEDWRPDRSDVLISFRSGPAPDGKMDGVDFELTGSHEKIAWPPLVGYIATLIVDGTPVYLSLPGDIGFQSPWVYLNDIPALQAAIAERHFANTVAALKAALQIAIDYPKTPLPDGTA
jgi:hypothetical protein